MSSTKIKPDSPTDTSDAETYSFKHQNEKEFENNNDNDNDNEPPLNKALYMCIYSLSICYYGICLSLSGAIYVELKMQLNTKSSTIAYILSIRSISFIFGGLLGAYIIDNYKETHKFFAFVVLCSGISLSIIPFVKSIPLMFILWIPIGFAMGCAELSNSVYIFRLFPKKDGGRMLLLSIAMYHFGKLTAPLIVQGSIEFLGSYKHCMWIFSFIALMYSLIVPWLKTPPYDKLRALKREIVAQREKIQTLTSEVDNNCNIYNNDSLHNELVIIISDRLKTDKTYRNKQYLIIILLIICYALFSMIRNGFTTFITTFISEYLGMNDSIGRYLIVTFYLGQFIIALIGSMIKNLNPRKSVLASFGFFFIFTIIFIIFGQEIIVIFIVFALAGCVGGVTYPFLYAWCELIRPLTGLLSCLFTLAYGLGDAIISVIVAQVINQYGIRYYAIPLLGCSVIACIVCIINSIIYIKYKQYEHKIIKEIGNNNQQEHTNIELYH